MQKSKQFIFTAFLILILFFMAPFVRAYEQDQLSDCILSALKNPSIEGVPKSSIQNYCQCALDLIVDQNKDIRESGYKCATTSFGEAEN